MRSEEVVKYEKNVWGTNILHPQPVFTYKPKSFQPHFLHIANQRGIVFECLYFLFYLFSQERIFPIQKSKYSFFQRILNSTSGFTLFLHHGCIFTHIFFKSNFRSSWNCVRMGSQVHQAHQFHPKLLSMLSKMSLCAPLRLSAVSLKLLLKQFKYWSGWTDSSWPLRVECRLYL